MTHSPAETLRAFAVEFDKRLGDYLSAVDVPTPLLNAVRYSALAHGKRIRPYLVVRCCELSGGHQNDAWSAAAAVECVHAFSLIHDDLPAMDDDDLRRGQPTTHKKFGEALAILAGDALLALAFELIARDQADHDRIAAMTLELARQTGWSGMIGGQAADILGQGTPSSEKLVEYIHQRKTACLFEASCRIGALAGKGDSGANDALARFGRHLGRAFQIADDLLDVTASAGALGKKSGKDESAGKQTYPQCVGVDASRAMGLEESQAAVAQLLEFGDKAEDLRALAGFVVSRNY